MKSMILTASATAALLLAGCQENEDLGQTPPVNAAQDVASTGVGMASAVVGGLQAETYVPAAHIADMYEIRAAEIALEKGQDARVRELAQMIISDHRTMASQMEAALPQAQLEENVTLPEQMDERRQGMIDNLQAASADTFDLAYLHQQLAAHLEALTLHSEYAEAGDSEVLKPIAAQAAEKIEKHLAMVREVGGEELEAMAN
ncbi:DUF4142 domain-containing protein [Phenylobacterium sp.]|uniref:DUF4142 domain-containing protein n=1 Tax=Phenylobacterium sp. TaxID=1871053 RepID=UPI0019965E9D|nr:DUF4142 domain-containing protein [Phenylobacterium sp.]MBC7168613.1 DUF4142 domain-containing protein [Phenylobacterium sp.]